MDMRIFEMLLRLIIMRSNYWLVHWMMMVVRVGAIVVAVKLLHLMIIFELIWRYNSLVIVARLAKWS